MKSFILRAGLFTCLIFLGWSHEQASAEMSFSSKCGEIKQNLNPSLQQMNCLLTNAALEANIPPEVVKAVATQENGGWKQFTDDGQPYISSDGGIGVMQITNQSSYDQDKLKNDIYYNIQSGVDILNSMYNRTDLPKIKGVDRDVIENWYFPVMAYNGTKPINSPLIQADGTVNKNAYQEKVFAIIERDSFLNDTNLAKFPFSTADFKYQPNSDQNIIFNKLEYTITDQMHASTYLFHTGDKVVVTKDNVKLRSKPDSTSDYKLLGKNTILIINGDFLYDQSNSNNRFVWYPVKTSDEKLIGYISSAYINKLLNGWGLQSGKQYHYTNGVLNTGWYKEGNNYFYLDPNNGGAMQTGWLKNGNDWYYLANNGIMQTGWLKNGNDWYYLANNGKMQTGWLKNGNDWYYLANNGKIQTGWLKNGNNWYFLANNGKMQTGWIKNANDWYYLANSGKMQTGWLKNGNDWYYLANNGKMLTGWQKISGKWYYLYSNGKMAHDTKIGKYRLGHNGAMI